MPRAYGIVQATGLQTIAGYRSVVAIPNATVWVYEPGTVTPIAQVLYAADVGGTTLANPLTTDASGIATFWLDTPQFVTVVKAAAGYVTSSERIGVDFPNSGGGGGGSSTLTGDVTGTTDANVIAANAVTTAKIASGAVTGPKLAAGSATGAALGADVLVTGAGAQTKVGALTVPLILPTANTRLYDGTGVPSGALGANGDLYFRNDGGATSSVYQKVLGAWLVLNLPAGGAAGGGLSGTYPNPTLAAGVATGAVLGSDVISTSAAAQTKTGTFQAPLKLPNNVTLWDGAGVPNNANGANGDIYIRNDGAGVSALYQRVGGVWIVIAQGGPPTGAAGGSLAGTYPSPTLAAGVATGAVLGADVLVTGAGAQTKTGTLQVPIILPSNVRLWDGSGAPSNGTGNNGDLFFRSDGAGTATIYQKTAGAWALVGQSGPPSGAAGGVLAGTYPNPSLAAGAATGAALGADVLTTGAAQTKTGALTAPIILPTALVRLWDGTGVPNNANGNNGDLYFRSDGSATSSIYQKVAGVWAVLNLPAGGAAGGVLAGTYPNPTLAAGVATGAVLGADVINTGASSQTKTGVLTAPLILPAANVRLWDGTGVPNNANGANGDLYFRSDGGAATTIYQKVGGAWVALSMPTSGAAGGALSGTYPNPALAAGVATGAVLGADVLTTSGGAQVKTGTLTAALILPGTSQLHDGTGVPSGALGANGDLYLRRDGLGTAATPSVYHKSAGVWIPIAQGGAPTGTAGGALAGSFPNPSLAAGAATGAALGSDVINTGAGAQTKTGAFTAPIVLPTANVRLWDGTGVPNNGTGSNGDLYFRSDGAGSATIYQRVAGVWALIGQSGPPTGAAAGSLAGTYPNPTLAAGVATGAVLGADVLVTGAGAQVKTGTLTVPIILPAASVRLWDGTGVPGAGTGANGDIYVRSDGSATATLYQKVAGAWVLIGQSGPPTGAAGGDLTGSTYPNPTIAANAVTGTKIDTNAVSTAKIVDLAVTTAKLADLAVSTAKIADAAVATAKIADLAVTTAKIAANAVTAAKLGAAAATGAALGTDVLTRTNHAVDRYLHGRWATYGDVDPYATPATSLAALIAAAGASTTIDVPDGVYRESVSLGNTKILQPLNAGKVFVVGSDIWTDEIWMQPNRMVGGRYWMSTKQLNRSIASAFPTTVGTGAQNVESEDLFMVFIDGQMLHCLPTGVLPQRPDEFSVDRAGRVILGTNPYSHMVEVVTRTTGLTYTGTASVLGLTFQHLFTGTVSQVAGVRFNSQIVTFNSNVVRFNHGIGAGGPFAPTSNVNLNQAYNNGNSGFGLTQDHIAAASYPLAESYFNTNSLHHNNVLAGDWAFGGGGIKASNTNHLTMDGNLVWSNNGPGLWHDIYNTEFTIKNNKCWRNGVGGIYVEISGSHKADFGDTNQDYDGAQSQIFNNSLWENGSAEFVPNNMNGSGFISSTSHNLAFHDNWLAWNGQGIEIFWDSARTQMPVGTSNDPTNIVVYGNYIAQETNWPAGDNPIWAYANAIKFNGAAIAGSATNGGYANHIYLQDVATGALVPDATGYGHYRWNGTEYNTIATFNGTDGGSLGAAANSDRITLAAFNAAAGSHGVPAAPENGHGIAYYGTFSWQQSMVSNVMTATGQIDHRRNVVLIDATAGAINATLPDAGMYAMAWRDKPLFIRRIDNTASVVTLIPRTDLGAAAQPIDGAGTKVIAGLGKTALLPSAIGAATAWWTLFG